MDQNPNQLPLTSKDLQDLKLMGIQQEYNNLLNFIGYT